MLHRTLSALFLVALLQVPAFAADGEEASHKAGVLSLLPGDVTTQHVLDTDSGKIDYSATAGTLHLFGQDGSRAASIFYTAYTAKAGAGAGERRPITFVFNGGPGAASAFLNLGLVGPRIADFGPDAREGAAAKLVDNPQSWLRFTDLVFIDPIGTGWSRTAKPDDAKKFYSVGSDASSIAKAISLYLVQNNRAASPKYLLGESYGGFRALKVASDLRDDQGFLVSGIAMLSPLIDGRLVFGGDKFPLGAALELPSLVAAAQERAGTFDKAAISDAEHFAIHDYLPMLVEGRAATSQEAVYDRLAELTGIPLDVIRRSRGMLGSVYAKHVSPGNIVSAYDAGFVAPDAYPETDRERGGDPILDGFTRAYGGLFANYARNELNFKTEMTYTLLSTEVNSNWKWGSHNNDGSPLQANASDDLRELLAVQPSLHVLIAQGYSDMVIPYGYNKFILDHLPATLSGRTSLKLYNGGHMFYTSKTSRTAFTQDAKAFYSQSTADPAGTK